MSDRASIGGSRRFERLPAEDAELTPDEVLAHARKVHLEELDRITGEAPGVSGLIPDEVDARILNGLRKALPYESIAQMLGVDSQVVARRVNQIGELVAMSKRKLTGAQALEAKKAKDRRNASGRGR